MRIVISPLALVAVALVACGGTTDEGDGATTGGSNGNGQAGSLTAAGSSSAGSAGQGSAGGPSGGISSGGTAVGGVSSAGSGGTSVIIGGGGSASGGTGSVDPRCPSKAPSGMCDSGLAGLACQYEPGSNCLCYPTGVGVYLPCTKVDPTCTAATPGDGGSGGVSTKIALPPNYKCTCDPTSSSWSCGYGI